MTSGAPSETCVSFLLPSLVIDRPWKLVVSCVGVVLLSAFVEICTLGRRFLPTERQGDVGLVFHVVSLVLAYLVMLFVMTYSIELFCSVIVGLAVGHKVAGTVARSRAWEVGAGAPCCRLAAGLDGGASPGTAGEASAELAPRNSTEGLTTVHLSVSDMTCEACTETVRRALQSVEGVHVANVSLRDASAEVLCRPSGTIARELCAASSDIGFEACLRGARQLCTASRDL